jgi:ribosomal protein S7
VPRILRAAIIDQNRAFVKMLAQFMSLAGALEFCMERYDVSSDAVVRTLLRCLDEAAEAEPDMISQELAGLLQTAADNAASHRVTLELLKRGATPKTVAVEAFLGKKGSIGELQQLFEAGAELPEDVMKVAMNCEAPHEQLCLLLRHGGQPRSEAARAGVQQGINKKQLLELFNAGAEVYDNILYDADQRAASPEVMLELLRCGGEPRTVPLDAALRRRAGITEVLQLLEAKAELSPGVLTVAADNRAQPELLTELLRRGGEPRSVPLRVALERRAEAPEVLEILKARAEVYSDVLNTAVKTQAPHAVMVILLQRGGTPTDVPLRVALENKHSTAEVSALLEARACLFDGILQTAVENSANVGTVLELLRLGATPRTAPLHGALRQGWPAEDLQSLIQAKAEPPDGLLQVAHEHKNTSEAAWKYLVSLVSTWPWHHRKLRSIRTCPDHFLITGYLHPTTHT